MAKPILTVCRNLDRSNYQESAEALREAFVSISNNHEFDGAIILLTKRDKTEPLILRAGRMRHAGNALLQLERLSLYLVVDNEDED